ncbi:MAG: DUF4837 family protein [Flavobacteriales bacterium]|nr:DUF4837 family protein [Flavobacteriales bacterium]MCB9191766.1 DUF4837 family protein [Flavobacteriales bacterium]MCB9203572.1 DUF4837 family protein [Flavobacteriales bacterium]
MRWTLGLLTLIFIAACDVPEMPLPGVTGKAGELVVVMPERNWKGSAGDTVFNSLTEPVYGLPQAEPIFNVVHIKTPAFTSIFQTHRNIVVANIGEEHEKRIELKTDVWATPQVVVEIWAPNNEAFAEIFGSNRKNIIGHVLKKEEERILKSYNAQLNEDAVKPVKDKWGLTLSIPKGYNIVRDEPEATWVRYETKDVTQSILIYSEPYTKENTFSVDGMIEVMDSYSKRFVPGPDNGTYMTTFKEYPPKLTETSIASNYASKLIGLWNIEGALMGGPFVSYAFLNAEGTRVYYLHGFVFAPGKDKRNYLRQVEAIIRSARF